MSNSTYPVILIKLTAYKSLLKKKSLNLSYKLKLTSKEGGPSVCQFYLEFFQMFQDIFYVTVHRQVILVVKGLRGGANDLRGKRKISDLFEITLLHYFTECVLNF
jgi:hypothetical protein